MIVIVAKKPEPGRVKTRLCPPLTPLQAACLAEAFLTATVFLAIYSVAGMISLGVTPADAREWFTERFGLESLDQGEGDLGARMKRLFEQGFSQGESEVLLIGADTPHLLPERLATAGSELRCGADVVLGPAEDGGYYLIGLRRPAPSLFDGIEWGGPAVLGQTLGRAHEAGLTVALLPTERDIDTADDLEWLLNQPGMEWVTRAIYSPCGDMPTAKGFPCGERPPDCR